MATELLQPGVSVIQEFRTVSPTIVTPTLVPCAVAPCFQVIDALETDATGNQVLNTDAVASVPAILTSQNPGPYNGLDGKKLIVSYNNGAPWEVAFSDPTALGLSVGQVKDQIAAASPAPSGWGAYVLTKNSSEYVQLRSTAGGDGQTLQVLDGDANSILGFDDFFTGYGVSKYYQDKINVSQSNFPDPRGIIDEIDIDESSIRVFMNAGTALREFKRDESFLRRKKECVYTSEAITFPTTTLTGTVFSYKDTKSGTSVEFGPFLGEMADVAALVSAMNGFIGETKLYANGADRIDFVSDTGYFEAVEPAANSAHTIIGWDGTIKKAFTMEASDDGDGDTRTPFVVADRDNFTAPEGSAQLTGSATLTGGLELNTLTFEVQVDGGMVQEVTFTGDPIVGGAFVGGNTLAGETLALVVNGTTKTVTFSADGLTEAQAAAEINAAVGVPVCYPSNAATGEYSLTPDRLVFVLHTATYVDGVKPSIVDGADVWLDYSGSDATAWTDLGLPGALDLHQTLVAADAADQINTTMPGLASIVSNNLQLDSTDKGAESKIEIGNGTSNTIFGFTQGEFVTGAPFPVAVGDSVYADGNLIGYVAVVAPGGNSQKLKLDREVDTTAGYVYFYIQALGIPSSLPSTRPTPNLIVDSAGDIVVKHDFVRDTEGAPIEANGQLIISYKALRLDVTPAASNPGILTLDDVTDLEDALAPINTDNPLSMMLYFMLINAPGISVTGIGVDGTSTSFPDGTDVAYSKALSFLEKEEVYALAPASQNPIVHQIFGTHVTSTSQPDNKGERIVFICPEMPGEAIPALVTSGTDGDYTGVANEFDTKLASLAADVLGAGVDPTGTIDVSEGLYLDIAADNSRYNISSISGTKISIRVAFAPGENDDNFYSTSNLPTSLISETFAIYVRGQDLVDSNGDPDYHQISQAYQDLGTTYGNRRMVMVAPENVGAVIDAVEQSIPGYYLCAAIAGMVGQQPPQQGFTNFPITGFTRVLGSNDRFSASQMSVGAAGGTYWVVQNVAGGPLTCRHQLTTDLTSIETRELSITKVVDFTAKFMRAGLRNFIGKFNITQPFLDTLSTVVQGQLSFLTEAGVLIGGDLNNIVQDESAPDTVLIDVTLDVPYPCNYIRLTLVI